MHSEKAAERQLEKKEQRRDTAREGVRLMTLHAAKGLEFDTVIIPDFNKMASIVGSYNVDWQDFYVGCTRARSNLFLFSNNNLPSLNGVVDISRI